MTVFTEFESARAEVSISEHSLKQIGSLGTFVDEILERLAAIDVSVWIS
jgi:hypothetical protein